MIALPGSELLPALLMGGVLGFFGGVFGIGGGIVAIPVLVVVYGMDQATAQGTALVMMVPNLAVAWLRYGQRNPQPLTGAVAIALTACVATWGAAMMAQAVQPAVLKTMFCAFLLYLAARMLGQRAKDGETERFVFERRWAPLVGLAGGGSMGLLGVGGGLVATPLLCRWFGLGQRAAQSMALALVTPASAVALSNYGVHNRVDWGIGGALAVGGIVTVSLGVRVAHACPERVLSRLFAVMLAASALAVMIRSGEVG
jgi:uncharacterized membrane protein YfcA